MLRRFCTQGRVKDKLEKSYPLLFIVFISHFLCAARNGLQDADGINLHMLHTLRLCICSILCSLEFTEVKRRHRSGENQRQQASMPPSLMNYSQGVKWM